MKKRTVDDIVAEHEIIARVAQKAGEKSIETGYNMVLDSLKAAAFDRLCRAAADPNADLRKMILESALQIEQRKADERT